MRNLRIKVYNDLKSSLPYTGWLKKWILEGQSSFKRMIESVETGDHVYLQFYSRDKSTIEMKIYLFDAIGNPLYMKEGMRTKSEVKDALGCALKIMEQRECGGEEIENVLRSGGRI